MMSLLSRKYLVNIGLRQAQADRIIVSFLMERTTSSLICSLLLSMFAKTNALIITFQPTAQLSLFFVMYRASYYTYRGGINRYCLVVKNEWSLKAQFSKR